MLTNYVNNLSNLVNQFVPVSYTHLDVYKRQECISARLQTVYIHCGNKVDDVRNIISV